MAAVAAYFNIEQEVKWSPIDGLHSFAVDPNCIPIQRLRVVSSV